MHGNPTNNPHRENTKSKDISLNNTSPLEKESYGYHLKIPYTISHEEINIFIRITREYARQIGTLPTTTILTRRKRFVRLVMSTYEHTLVKTVEDLVDFSLHEIEPFDLIPNTPIITPPTINWSDNQEYSKPEEEESDLESEDLDYKP